MSDQKLSGNFDSKLDHAKFDHTKRRTIKMLGAAPLFTLPVIGSTAGAAQLDALVDAETQSAVSQLPVASPRTSNSVEIQIINSTSVLENSVLIRNTTDERLTITRFMPGHIIFDGQHMDLNAVLDSQVLSLEAGQSKSLLFDMGLAKDFRHVEYVWADHATDKLNESTSVVTLGAFMADTDAVVYANMKQYIPS